MMFGERRCARWYIARGHYDEAEQARHVYKLAKIASGYEVPYVDGWTVDAPKNFWNDASLHFVLTLKDAYRKGNRELGKPFRAALGEWLAAVAKSPDLSEAPESRVAIWNDALEVDGDFVALYGGDQEHVDLVLSLVECEWAAAAMCEAAEYHDDVRRENVLLRAGIRPKRWIVGPSQSELCVDVCKFKRPLFASVFRLVKNVYHVLDHRGKVSAVIFDKLATSKP